MRSFVLLSFFGASALACTAPYSTSKFQDVLDDSKLQAPDSSTKIDYGDFSKACNSYFYVKDGRMTFKVTGDAKRSELRQKKEWKTSDSTANKMIGYVEVEDPESTDLDETTFMQIHDNNDGINAPLLRLSWIRSRDSYESYYWATIKTDTCKKCKNYEKFPIGPWKNSPVKFEVRVQSNNLTIKRFDKTVVSNFNVSYWKNLSNYFKAGIYNQDSGTGTSTWTSLKYYS